MKEQASPAHCAASFIGARLQYPCPENNGQGNPWVSTIKVEQHKIKFDQVRVYCTLAHPSLVQQKWAWLVDRERRRSRGVQFYDRIHSPSLLALVQAGEILAPDVFSQSCMMHDAIWYRKVHCQMISMCPDVKRAIIVGADHPELLHDSPALTDASDHLLQKYGLGSNDALHEFMRRAYTAHQNDILEYRD
jgi:hypothetical protein